MNKTTKFIITSIWILLTRGYDAYATYQFTPDLSKEGNPLVAIFGFTWAPLLIVIIILSIWVIYAFYKASFSSYSLLPKEKNYNYSNFIGYVYTGKKQEWYTTLYKLPKDFNRFNLIMGNLLTQCLVFTGLVSTTMWLLINNTEFYKEIHSIHLVYSILLIGSALICHNWFSIKFQEYKTASNIP